MALSGFGLFDALKGNPVFDTSHPQFNAIKSIQSAFHTPPQSGRVFGQRAAELEALKQRRLQEIMSSLLPAQQSAPVVDPGRAQRVANVRASAPTVTSGKINDRDVLVPGAGKSGAFQDIMGSMGLAGGGPVDLNRFNTRRNELLKAQKDFEVRKLISKQFSKINDSRIRAQIARDKRAHDANEGALDRANNRLIAGIKAEGKDKSKPAKPAKLTREQKQENLGKALEEAIRREEASGEPSDQVFVDGKSYDIDDAKRISRQIGQAANARRIKEIEGSERKSEELDFGIDAMMQQELPDLPGPESAAQWARSEPQQAKALIGLIQGAVNSGQLDILEAMKQVLISRGKPEAAQLVEMYQMELAR